MKETLARKATAPKKARNKVLYDTQELVQNQANVDFFDPQASRDISMANYIQNPFPGENAHLIYGLSLELVKQHITTDADNSIDAPNLINAVKDSGFTITADQDSREFLRTRTSDHFNFEGTHLDTNVALAGQAAAPDQQLTVEDVVTIQSSDLYRVPDPFIIAPNQVMNLGFQFADASVFPTSQNWTDAGQSKLYMRAKLHVRILTPDMQVAMGV